MPQPVYVHLLPEDLPEPSFLDDLAASGGGVEESSEEELPAASAAG
jgi:hypothetical protein